MPASYSVATEITGRGNLSEFAKRCSSALQGMVAPINAINAAVSKPETTALGRVGSMADTVAGRFRSGLGSITAWLPALGALGATASIGGLIAMTRSAAEGSKGIALASEKLGVSVQQLAAWRVGAKMTHVENEVLEKGLVKLNKTMGDAATGKNADVALLFRKMKIPLRDAKGHINGAANSLGDIAEAFKNTENTTTRTNAAIALFGRAGADLLPFLIKGRAGIAELEASMAKFSSLTKPQHAALGALANDFEDLDRAGSGLSKRLSAAFAPALSRIVRGTTDWIVANRELIGQALDRKIEKMGRAIKIVSGAGAALLAVPWIAELVKGANASTAFDVGLAALGLTMAGPLLAAVQKVTLAIWALSRATWANPLGLFLLAIAAAAYVVYANWDSIVGWFEEQMDAIRAAFDRGFGEGLLEIFNRFSPFNVITSAVNGLSKWLFGIDLFEAGANLITRLISGIKSMLPDLSPVLKPVNDAISWLDRKGLMGDATTPPAAAQATAAGYAAAYAGGPMPSIDPLARSVNAAAPASKLEVVIDFLNMPPGIRADTRSTGPMTIERNVGYSMTPNW